VRRLLIYIVGRRLVIHHTMVWYAIDKGYRTASVCVLQASDTYSIRGNMTVRVRYYAIYTGILFSQCRRKRSNPRVDLLRDAVVVAYILKMRDSSM
jgi:hypothetical protein